MGHLNKLIFVPLLAAALLFWLPLRLQSPAAIPTSKHLPQAEITRVSLLITGLKPNIPDEVGWMAKPLRLFNPGALDIFQRLRLKKWDYFDIMTEDAYHSIAIADLTYLGKIIVLSYDFKTRKMTKVDKDILPFSMPELSSTSYKMYNSTLDDINYQSGDLKFQVHNKDGNPAGPYHSREVTFTSPSDNIKFNIKMNATYDHECIGIVQPLSEDLRYFYYNLKYYNIPVEGSVSIKGKEYQFNQLQASAGLDWGRGVWPYNTYWVWAKGQGFLADGKRFGINMGGGFANLNNSLATEDSFFVEKYMYKLDTVYWKFDEHNLKNPWVFETVDRKNFKDCHVVFTPNYEDVEVMNLGVATTDFRRVFGQYSGWVTNDQGKKYTFEGINGIAEVHKAQW